MNIKYSVIVCKVFSILILLFLSNCKSSFSHIEQSANYTTTQPMIDGVMDTLWTKANEIKLSNYNLGAKNVKGSSDLSANYRILWDSTMLYLLVKVIDDIKFDIRKLKNSLDIPEGYECDCVELFFDSKNRKINKSGSFDVQKGDSRFEFAYSRRGITGAFKSIEGIDWAQVDTSDGYMFEIAIPLETISISSNAGYNFGFEISIYDNDYSSYNLQYYNYDDRSSISWSQKEGAEAYQNIGLLGSMTLSSL